MNNKKEGGNEDSNFLLKASGYMVMSFTEKGNAKGEQFGFGSWISVGHVKLEIPVNFPRTEIPLELAPWRWRSRSHQVTSYHFICIKWVVT